MQYEAYFHNLSSHLKGKSFHHDIIAYLYPVTLPEKS